jgi:hypothetical protein
MQLTAANRLRLRQNDARGIKKRADEVTIYCDQHNEPAPSLHDRTIDKSKPGRRPALTELQINQLDHAISQDRQHRELPQVEVSRELGFEAGETTVRNAANSHQINRVKSTKKLALTPIQGATRYEIALSRKDYKLEDWKRVSFSDEAAILVGKHRGKQLISRKPDEAYEKDCIQVRYNNYTEAMFWGTFSYDTKEPCVGRPCTIVRVIAVNEWFSCIVCYAMRLRYRCLDISRVVVTMVLVPQGLART